MQIAKTVPIVAVLVSLAVGAPHIVKAQEADSRRSASRGVT